MFVSAFPLAPLFSLLNSIVEIRVDAINFVSQFRRPDTVIAEDIGAWTKIMTVLTRVSVLVNAFILAFTSEFIPKLVYRNRGDGSLKGYLEDSLASINITHLKGPPEHPNQNVNTTGISFCRYERDAIKTIFYFWRICIKFVQFSIIMSAFFCWSSFLRRTFRREGHISYRGCFKHQREAHRQGEAHKSGEVSYVRGRFLRQGSHECFNAIT